MSILKKIAIVPVALLASAAIAGTASAQAGAACSGVTCGLGGQIRAQIGDGLPIPITFAAPNFGSGPAAISGPFTGITIRTSMDHLSSQRDFVGNGLGQIGQIKPVAGATIQQGATVGGPRSLSLPVGIFNYHGMPTASAGVAGFNAAVFAVKTNISFDTPHPGTTTGGASAFTFNGGSVPTPNANVFLAGGRDGAAIVSYYQSASDFGTVGTNFGATTTITPNAGTGTNANPPINGVARFTATSNQFGGQAIGRSNGTAKVYFVLGAVPALPCKVVATPGQGTTAQGTFVAFNTGANCAFAISVNNQDLTDATVGIRGGAFGARSDGAAFTTPTGIFTGTIGFNGTIIGTGAAVTTPSGMGISFSGQGNQEVGFPFTTGRLTIQVNDVVGSISERFVRTGIDARDADGNGVVALVSGSMTARDISQGNANSTWMTLEIPEPSAILAASAGLFALFGCHQIVRRRS